MSNPFNWHFPQRQETMFMSTIDPKSSKISARQSSFIKKDIPGAYPMRQIPFKVTRENFNNSTLIEPSPQSHILIKNHNIPSNSLRTDDIEGARPQAFTFKTNRVVDPNTPRYILPYVHPAEIQPSKKFLRNTLDISDIVKKGQRSAHKNYPKKEEIQGSQPSKHFRTINAISRFSVKDINEDRIFRSGRINKPTDPLQPSYTWRSNHFDRFEVNNAYGDIGNHSRIQHPVNVNKRNDLSLNINDIQGTNANSANESKYFFSKRKDYRQPLNNKDIARSQASTLKKGITTNRVINPLMPDYRYPFPQ